MNITRRKLVAVIAAGIVLPAGLFFSTRNCSWHRYVNQALGDRYLNQTKNREGWTVASVNAALAKKIAGFPGNNVTCGTVAETIRADFGGNKTKFVSGWLVPETLLLLGIYASLTGKTNGVH